MHLSPMISRCRTAAQQIGRHDTEINTGRNEAKARDTASCREPVVQVLRALFMGSHPRDHPRNPLRRHFLTSLGNWLIIKRTVTVRYGEKDDFVDLHGFVRDAPDI